MNYACWQTLAKILTSEPLLMNIQYVFCLYTVRKKWEADRSISTGLDCAIEIVGVSAFSVMKNECSLRG